MLSGSQSKIPGHEYSSCNKGKYHTIGSCDATLGVDALLSCYTHDRNIVMGMMQRDPNTLVKTIWKQDSPLAIDKGCMCQMGNGTIRSPFSCAQCKNLRRIMDFRDQGCERAFELQCGKHVGKKLQVTSIPVANPFLSWNHAAAQRAKLFVSQYRDLMLCGTPNLESLQCIMGDTFTLQVLVTWVVNTLFEAKGLYHCPTMYTAFICRDKGYILSQVPSIGNIFDLYNIGCPVARPLIIQLLVILGELSAIRFSHGTPGIRSLCFSKEPVSYMYDTVHVNANMTVQITNLWNACCTVGNTHYYRQNVESNLYVENTMFIPEIVTSKTFCETPAGTCDTQGTSLYRLSGTTLDVYKAMRHIGFPLYVGSFDLYCFITTLMRIPQFFEEVMTDTSLYEVWCMMWLPEDRVNVEREIKAHSLTTYPTSANDDGVVSVDIIRNKWLRCDVVAFVWSLIKRGY